MKKGLALVLLLTLLNIIFLQDNIHEKSYLFENFKLDYERSYSTPSEEEYRKTIFFKNVNNIEKHNSNPLKTHTQGINRFTDLTA